MGLKSGISGICAGDDTAFWDGGGKKQHVLDGFYKDKL